MQARDFHFRLFNLASPLSYFAPALTSAPVDYSLAIAYAGPTTSNVVTSITPTATGTAYQVVPAVTILLQRLRRLLPIASRHHG